MGAWVPPGGLILSSSRHFAAPSVGDLKAHHCVTQLHGMAACGPCDPFTAQDMSTSFCFS